MLNRRAIIGFLSLLLLACFCGPATASLSSSARRDAPPAQPVDVNQLTSQMMNHMSRVFSKVKGGLSRQVLSVSNPTPMTTMIQVKWPTCLAGKAALLATFCVLTTTKEMEADPNNLLPRFTVQVEAEPKVRSSVGVFLFDDDDEAYMALFRRKSNISSCASFAAMSSAAIFPNRGSTRKVEGSRSIRTASPHKWYIVAADCGGPSVGCSNVSHASVQYYHPNSEGGLGSCYATGALSNLRDMKEFMSVALSFNVRDLFRVAGISPFGVSVLYSTLALMLSSVLVFWTMTKWEQEAGRKEVYVRCTVAATLCAACYLALASGNGFTILRRVGSGPASGWVYSTQLMDASVDPVHGAKTYPFLWLRYGEELLTTPLVLYNLFALTDLPRSTVMLALFCNAMMWVSWLEAAAINAPSEWLFALIATLFCAAVVGLLLRGFGATEGRSRPTRRLFSRTASIAVGCWAALPLIWIVGDGTKAMPIDVLLMMHLTWDVLVKCVVGMVLLRGIPDIGTLLESAAHELEGAGLKLGNESGVGYDDSNTPLAASRATL